VVQSTLGDSVISPVVATKKPHFSILVLVALGPHSEAFYYGIQAQYAKAGTVEEKIWIRYLEEGIGKLEEDYRVQVPIADKVSEVADEYLVRLYRKLSSSRSA